MSIASLLRWMILGLGVANAAATVTPLPGTTPQQAVALTPFANELGVRVTDAAGVPVNGAAVSFQSGPGIRVAPEQSAACNIEFMFYLTCQATSDADGVARFPGLRGEFAGTYEASISARTGSTQHGEATFQLTVLPIQAPAVLSIASGNHQRAVIGTALAPIVVQLRTAAGNPLPGAEIHFSPFDGGMGGGFALPIPSPPYSVTTDLEGRAQLPVLTSSWGVGPQQANALYVDYAARVRVETPIEYVATNALGGFDLALEGLWWSGPAENGWGLSVFQRGEKLFNVLFVYDDAGKPTWLMQSSGHWRGGFGGSFDGMLYSPRGSPWWAFDPAALRVGAPLSATQTLLSFRGPESVAAYVSLDRPVQGYMQTVRTDKQLMRMSFARAQASPLQGVGGLWWGGPQQNGWGIAIHEQQGALFLVWYTYDESGAPTWVYMPEGSWTDTVTYAGTLYRATGSAWQGVPYDATKFRSLAVGTYSLRFAGTAQAELHYTLDGRSGVLVLQRFDF